jgi:Proteasome stabiliser
MLKLIAEEVNFLINTVSFNFLICVGSFQQDCKLKMQAYSTAGRLGQKVPALVNKDLALVQAFFEALAQEEAEAKEAVREALLSFASAFDNLEPAKRTMLAAMLAKLVESPEPMVRFVAVRYIIVAFPSTDAASRLLLLLATTDL